MKFIHFLKLYFVRIWKKALQHKVLAVLGAGYYAYGKFFSAGTPVKYVLAAVQKGTFISSVTGSGQVSASNQLDLKPKVSWDIDSITKRIDALAPSK